jgi:hypothetical protein
MHSSFVAIAACFVAAGLSPVSANDLAPSALRGKSAEVSWTQNWTTRPVGGTQISNTRADNVAVFYFSSAGRIFARRSINQRFSGGKRFTVDAVGNDQSTTIISPFSQITFDGRTMQAVRAVGPNDAVRLVVDFDASFSSCAATLDYANAPGRSYWPAPESGRMTEALAVTASNARCAVKSGNSLE